VVYLYVAHFTVVIKEWFNGGLSMKQYILNYVNRFGDTIARDYFDDIEKANSFMDEMIETYKHHDEDKGLILYDDDRNMVRYYEPEN